MQIKLNIKPLSVNKAWQGRRFRSKEYNEFRAMLLGDKRNIGLLFPYENLSYTGEIEIHYKFYLKNANKTDYDNLLKPLQDLLVEYKIIEDDRFITRAIIEKFKSSEDRIEIFIKENKKWTQKS